jgi:hypothetical protein
LLDFLVRAEPNCVKAIAKEDDKALNAERIIANEV